MRFSTTKITPTSTLSCYQLDTAEEMPTAMVRPAVVILPGGGFSYCSPREAEPVAMAYLAHGFNAFVVEYAAGDQVPYEDSYNDALANFTWVRDNADELGIDAHKIALVGFSAGGELAAALGTVNDNKPDAMVLGYPVTMARIGKMLDKQLDDCVSAVTPQTPPCFLFSTCGDQVVPLANSLSFLSALDANRVPFETHIYLLGGHGLSLANAWTAAGQANQKVPEVARWLDDSVRFLQTVLGDYPVSGPEASYQDLLDRQRFGLHCPLSWIMADPRGAEVLKKNAPQVVGYLDQLPEGGDFSLERAAEMMPELLTADLMATLEHQLDALNDH